MRLLLTGGGTAGHVYPLLSILDELKSKVKNERLDTLYIGSKGGVEEEVVKKHNISSIFIYSGKWRRYWLKWLPALLLNIRDLFLLLIGFFQAFFVVVRYRPDIIVAKGGYVTLPVAFASWFCRIPLIVHESDVVMGISNKICARVAKVVCVSFPPEYYKGLVQKKLVYTGNPIRKEFFKDIRNSQKQGKIPNILITGGSQGAQKINSTIFSILSELVKISNVYHLTGSLGYDQALKAKDSLSEHKNRYMPVKFAGNEMPEMMQKAKLIISRAGANTLAEIAAVFKPSILIPLKGAASNHQAKNAEIFQKNKAAVVLTEDELSSNLLFQKIKDLLENKELLKRTGKNAGKLSCPKAASLVVDEIMRLRS
ncbi:MAG: undecaprenyldiphospho-muramoylpentapeptide beta-N-acetylglucosaminyltransferase [Candidatus Berkelbacteria bacterium]|nr:undecaprenyldiphospho-muramoylpentapeptide beta-N-acetylglucosaminyltransferase [Candidatus Berkelbacteria bacterium]